MLELSIIQNLGQQEETGNAQEQSQELDADTLIRWSNEVRFQPSWRVEADRATSYYDGNQLDPDLAAELQQRGMGPLVTNLIAPTVRILLGTEAKTRSDWRVIADSDDYQEVAEAQSAKLFEAERETRADRACSDAYASQIIAGVGWVEVVRNSNPFEYPYRVQAIHRRELWWDWRAKKPDLSDAKYVIRKRWYDIDEVCSFFPESADVIRAAGTGWPALWLERAKEDITLMHAFDTERRLSMEDWEWRNFNNRTVAVTEVWYRVFVTGMVLDLPDRTVEVDLTNPMHMMALASGKVWPKKANYSKLRRAFFVGMHKLADDDMGQSGLPYIPFWGYREDLTQIPYGVVRSMIGPQDEVNARRRKLLWQLSAKRVVVDSDALDTRYNDFSDVVNEVARPDAVVVLNPQRRNAQGFLVDPNTGLSEQQFKIMEESKQAIQEVAGIFNAMMGRESSANSGLAINSLVEQGNTGAAEINDNYRYARRLVGERLLKLINEDLAGKPADVVSGEIGTKRRVIKLNQPAIDPQTGMQYLMNDVSKAKTKVALEDVPSTPAYRAQMQVMLAEVMKSLPPQLQATMAPYFIESTELKNRHEIAGQMKKAMGIQTDENGDEMDPQVQMLQQQIQEMQQVIAQGGSQMQQLQQQLADKQAELALKREQLAADVQMKGRELDIKALEADASVQSERIRAAAESRRAETDAALKIADLEHRRQESQAAREAQLLMAPDQAMPAAKPIAQRRQRIVQETPQ